MILETRERAERVDVCVCLIGRPFLIIGLCLRCCCCCFLFFFLLFDLGDDVPVALFADELFVGIDDDDDEYSSRLESTHADEITVRKQLRK
jgi:hypothetical protein